MSAIPSGSSTRLLMNASVGSPAICATIAVRISTSVSLYENVPDASDGPMPPA